MTYLIRQKQPILIAPDLNDSKSCRADRYLVLVTLIAVSYTHLTLPTTSP